MRRPASLLLFALLCLRPAPAAAQAIAPPPAPVAAVAIQSPEAFFGFRMGADAQLADWPSIEKYFAAVAAASDRVELADAGPTTEGRRLVAAIVSSPGNIRRLEQIKAANQRLADPRRIGAEEARALAASQPVVLAIGASIHATEIGATQAACELLHRLATATDEATLAELEQVVLVLLPSLNPDGHVLSVDWYRKGKGTEFEGGPMPWLYHKYVGHDLNRDSFMMNMAESRSLSGFFYRQWHPQVFLAMHQMGPRGPRMFVPPNFDPIDPNYDPIIWRTAGLLGHAMALALEEDGHAGVVQNAMYDYYWPGYEDSVPLGHNTVTLLTEVASVRVATPITVQPSELQGSPRGLPEYRARTTFPNPWPGGRWTLRDIVDYDLSAARGLIEGAARYRQELVWNFHAMARKAVDSGAKGGPFAFILPPDQHDPRAAHKLRQLLLDGGVEIQRALEPFRVAETVYPEGTDLVLMAQPYRAYAKTLLEKQDYPVMRPAPGAPPDRPYDVAGWTLPYQMGLRVDRIEQTFEPPPASRLTEAALTPGRLWGERKPDFYVVDGRGTGAVVAANRLLGAGQAVAWTTAPTEVAGSAGAAGALVVKHSDQARAVLERAVTELALQVTGGRGKPPVTQPLARLRIGLLKPWVENLDEGWTRWLLEQHEFPLQTLTDQDVRRGGLRAAHDVIVLPDASAERLRDGHAPGTVPPEYAGGLGAEGVEALAAFVRDGGTLVALDSSSQLAIEALALPVRDVLAGLPPEEFFCPGSLLRLEIDTAQPLGFGLQPASAAFFTFGGAFEPAPDAPGVHVVARYGSRDVLMSGWLEGESRIAGKAAVVEARVGKGRAILVGFRAQHRGQAWGTFRLLFNALLTQ